MAYYTNQGAFTNNLYPAPNAVLGNANYLSNQISQAGYTNFNGLNGCLPLQNNYQYPPGFAYMPGVPNSGGMNGFGFGQTDVSYTANANGVSYSYSNGPSTLDYISAIGLGLTGAVSYYYANKTNQQAMEYQQQAFERTQARQERLEDYYLSRQQKQESMSDTMNALMMLKMLNQMDKDT